MKVPHIYFLTAGPEIPMTVGSFLLLDRFFAWKQRLREGLNLWSYTFNPLVVDLTSGKGYSQLAPELIRMLHNSRANTAMRTWENVLSIGISKMWSPCSQPDRTQHSMVATGRC